jgi:hypothetical protein
MVRRFVEDQPVRLFEQRAREQRARALTAGEFFERPVEVAFGKVEAVERGAHLPLVGVAARERFFERRAQRLRAAFSGVLREIAEPRIAGAHDRAVVGFVDAGEQADHG